MNLKNIYTFWKAYIKMEKIIKFDDIEIEEQKFQNLNTLKEPQTRLNTLKEILITYSTGRFYAQLLHRDISGRT